jgi:hypothetical protein
MIVLFIDLIYTYSTKRGHGPEIRDNARVNLNKNVYSLLKQWQPPMSFSLLQNVCVAMGGPTLATNIL